MLTSCLHALDALGPDGLPALMGALFLAGLAGGASHCAAMCGPFVLAQMATGGSHGGGRLARLSGALLLPYHLGRGLGYATLGAVAGGFSALATRLPGLGLVPSLLLGLAGLAMLGQAVPALAARLPRGGFGRLIAPRLGRLLQGPGTGRAFLLGLMLSALPCGLLYAALAAAAASGSALAGALAMLAFVAGTAPALVALALLGRFFRRRAEPLLRRAAPPLYGFNALVLLALALRLA
ncbi:sulfite exporter TauE/SafE family protein [Belnapia sp. T18]|uniref:Sulfite exporter TauE/SafE family protein n=1 Tax=Belnapia arida TaxID=2804533 RepID=A0ABS1TVX2_9PROT|nr:sulfite exporter TauE/SafE family protein [Belnapia arida]MBL6076592.1 sulfite exporter TauE/SafE family protein [Belnapia arida]